MKKRILSIVLTLCMALMLVPISASAMELYVDLNITGAAPLTLEVESGDSVENVKAKIEDCTGYSKTSQILRYKGEVLENGRTLADYNIQKESTLELSLATSVIEPSVTAYATKAQLMGDTFAPNAGGTANNIGKLVFGKKSDGTTPQEWYILGKDSGVNNGENNTIIFAASPIATGQKFNSSTSNKNFQSSFGVYETAPSQVYSNHYGASDFRAALKAMETSNFTEAEQNLMNTTTVTTNDTKNSTTYTTTDILYALASDNASNKTIKAGSSNQTVLNVNSYWNTGEAFFLRSPNRDTSSFMYAYSVCFAYPSQGNVGFTSVKESFPAVQPASNLNLSKVLFASAATGGTGSNITSSMPMKLRFDGSSKAIGTVKYDSILSYDASHKIVAQKDPGATGNVFLMVQGHDGQEDWYYSVAVEGTTELTAGQIAKSIGSTNLSLANCKIWLETTDAADGLIYAVDAEASTYSVTLNANGGTVNNNVDSYTSGQETALPMDVTKKGYTFAGWYDNENFTGEPVTAISATDFGDKTFYAKWVHKHCICGGEVTAGNHSSHDSVTYQAWDGSLENRSPKGITYTDGMAYVFLENDAELTECIEVVGNKTLVLCLNGKKLERKDIEGGTSDQKKFIVKDGARLVICDCQGGGSIICGPSAGKGGAFYIDNGATMDFFGGKITNSSAEYGGAIAVTDLTPSAEVFNPSTLNIYGGEISGNTAKENGGAVYVTKNCTLNIYGDPVVKDNTAGGKANNIYLPSGQKLSVNDMKSGASIGITTESKGYPVAFTDVCDKDYSQYFHADLEGFHVSFSDSNQLELKANKYTVTLNANDGKINSGNIEEYTYGKGAKLPTDVTRTGYTFAGWYANEELTGNLVTEITATDIENKTFYAKWEANKYTVTLNANDGKINSGNIEEYTYGEGATLPTDVTRTGYTFAGWCANEDLTGEIVEKISTTEVDNKEYWAKWETNTYSFTLDTNGGIINKNYYKYGQQTILPTAEDITFTGHKFKGWYDNKELAGEPVTRISDTDLGDKTFYAKWEHTSDTSTITKITEATISTEGTIVESCRRCDEILATTVIPKIETVKLSASKLTYTGSGQVPLLTVEDAEGNTLNKGTDYTVSGLDKETSVGRYKVTITFRGNYKGTEELYFTIVPKAPASATATLTSKYSTTSGYNDVKFSWAKSTGATSYKVYFKKDKDESYTPLGSTANTYIYKKDLSSGVKYIFKVVPYYEDASGTIYDSETSYKTATVYTLKKLAAPTITRSGTKVKVKWTNISGETGYQISRSTSKTGTTIVSTYATTTGTYKLISATKGKTYYYKVRAYKTVDGKKIYGPWSNVTKYKR